MSGRGRKAVLPPPDFQATERIAADGLQATVVNKEGFERVFLAGGDVGKQQFQGSVVVFGITAVPGRFAHLARLRVPL